jgi:glycosyltransferase involved in cell wall biosynthesis
LRTALVTTSWPRFEGDPSGHFVAAEARRLTQRGEAVVVIAADGEAFGWPGVAARVKEDPRRAVGAAAWVAKARREVARGGFDRVVAHWAVPCAWPIATLSARGPARDYALDVVSHGGDVRALVRLPRPARAYVVRAIATRATTWRFVAAHLVEAMTARVPSDVARAVERVARVEPCVIDVDAPTRDAIDAKRAQMGAPFAVCVARLVASKRVDAAIAWAARERATLVVVGDGPERATLEACARDARERGARVTFVGRVARGEALAWIAASAEVVNASRVEGASTVEREAEALGVRVRAI